MSEEKPVIFGGAHFSKAIADDSFFNKLPQFKPIKVKMDTMHADLKNHKGCTPCQKRRIQANLERDFAAIVSSLDPDSGKKFKEYFGVSRMVIHAVNPTTHSAYLKEI
jgi:hypothetical protein